MSRKFVITADLPAARELMKAFFDRNLKGMDVKVEARPEAAVTVPGK